MSDEITKVSVVITDEMFAADASLAEKGLKVGDTIERDETPEETEARVAKVAADAKADAEAHQAEQAREAANKESEQTANGDTLNNVAPGGRHPLA